MPNPQTTYMLLVLPTEDSDPEIWDQLLNEALGGANGIDAHDHTTGRGKQIPSAGIGIDAALVFNNERATQVRGLSFTAVPSLLTTGALEYFSFGGDAYFRNGAGVNVRITNGSTLDVTSVGGIGGDYSAIQAEVAYVDASDTYTFKQQVSSLVRQWGRIACGGIDLYEYKAAGVTPVPGTRVRLSSPAGLAASYEMAMPPSLPGSTQILQLGASGQVTASNTIINPLTASGLITASAGVTLAVNQDVTVSGTGAYKHGDRVLAMNALLGDGGADWASNSTGSMVANAAALLFVPVPLHAGDRAKSITYLIFGDGSADLTATVVSLSAAMVPTTIGTATTNNQPASWSAITIDITDTVVVANGGIFIQFLSSANGIRVGSISVTYDRP